VWFVGFFIFKRTMPHRVYKKINELKKIIVRSAKDARSIGCTNWRCFYTVSKNCKPGRVLAELIRKLFSFQFKKKKVCLSVSVLLFCSSSTETVKTVMYCINTLRKVAATES